MDGLFAPEISRPVDVSLLPKCGACGLFKDCKSPKMPVSGDGQKGILVVAEAPGSAEDEAGTQLIGKAGKYLRECLAQHDIDLDRDCWKTNALICHPEGNRTPTDDEIDYCRPNLVRAIEEFKPRLIMPLGRPAIVSLLEPYYREDMGTMAQWAGWKIPFQPLNAWVTPNYHPSYVLRSVDAKEMKEGPVVKVWFERYLKRQIALLERPWQTVPDYQAEVRIVLDANLAANWIRAKLLLGGTFSFDYETDRLKPDHPEAEIVCASICWYDGSVRETIAFPWVGEVIIAVKEMLVSTHPKVGANCFSGDTKFLTREYGVVDFKTVCDQHVTVLNKEGRWVEAIVSCFGEQETIDATFCRRNFSVTVKVTEGHRWILSGGGEKVTSELLFYAPGRAADAVPIVKPCRHVDDVEDYLAGVRHGVVFGDGDKKKGRAGFFRVRLCGEKKELLSFFDGFTVSYYKSFKGDPQVYVTRQKVELKELPLLNVSDSYLIGFFRGLFATDGTVETAGQLSITGHPATVEWCKTQLPRVGYLFQGVTDRSKYASKYEGAYELKQQCQTIYLCRESVGLDDLLRSRHRNKYKSVDLGPYKFSKFGERHREFVYCAVVPDGESFVLDNGLLTGNCKFESRWSKCRLGIVPQNFVWDTVLGAHLLDNRKGITSLKFQAMVRLGLPDWSYSIKQYLEQDDGNGQNRIREVELRKLLLYCGIDSIAALLVAIEQRKELKHGICVD